MNPLPTTMVIDFCEWLKNRIEKESNRNEADILDLVLNQEHSSRLEEYAYEYLYKDAYLLRQILHQFIDSEDFKCCFEDRFEKIIQHGHYLHTDSHYFFRKLCNCFCYERVFDKFLLKYGKNEFASMDGPINPEHLVNSIHTILWHSDEPLLVMHFMVVNTNLSPVIDFLEWLMINKNKPMNLERMPLEVFIQLVDEFCVSEGVRVSSREKLIRSFRQTTPGVLAQKLSLLLPKSKVKKMKNLGYIYERYSNHNIPYKCLFLPLAADAASFKSFINKFWIDLHYLSGDFLDIYYGKEELNKSGYEIRNNLKSIPKDLSNKLPCVVLWGESMNNASTIDIKGLGDGDLFRLIAMIVDLIKNSTPFNEIIERTNVMAKELVNQSKPTTHITTTITHSPGAVAGVIDNSEITTNTTSSADVNSFSKEATEAIKLIQGYSEINEQQKKALIEIINEAKTAIEENSPDAKSESKAKFKGFILGAGNVTKNLLAILASLATLAKFFNINIP